MFCIIGYCIEEGLWCDFDFGSTRLRIADYPVGRRLELRGGLCRGVGSGGDVVCGTRRRPGIGRWTGVGGRKRRGYRGGGRWLNGIGCAAVQTLYETSLFPAHEYPVLAKDFGKPLLARECADDVFVAHLLEGRQLAPVCGVVCGV